MKRFAVILMLFALSGILALAASAQEDPWEQSDDWDDEWEDAEQTSAFHGFIEAIGGTRFNRDDLVGQRATAGEFRWRIENDWQAARFTLSLKADAGYDAVADDWITALRDLSVSMPVGDKYDLKLGRQVNTWGTGDLLFLNDLFPKDFVSFFAGRDDEYLKAPGNAIRISRFSAAVNADFVWSPVFESDVYLTGERFSFFSPLAGGNVAPDPPPRAVNPDKSFSDGEFALRLFRTINGREYAAYAYRGYFKQPSALTPMLQPTFAPLSAYGASMRSPAGPGLFNTELSWYDSRDDRSGSDPLTPNSQIRFLAGYEWEAAPRFTAGLQYYIEWTLNHDALVGNSLFPEYEADEFRHLLTNRLTYRTDRDRHTWSLFTFFSPSDRDFYLRPVYSYRHSDQWSASAGANLFGGNQPHTFFNQLRDASNAYLRIRYHY